MIIFYSRDSIPDEQLKFAVIVARYQGKWMFCRHKDRNTWEVPGGHREPGEEIQETARRELREETGALTFEVSPVCVYGFSSTQKTYGILCFAEIQALGPLEFEIQERKLSDSFPQPPTYPDAHPFLLEKVQEYLQESI